MSPASPRIGGQGVATYSFQAISDAQALAYDSTSDDLLFAAGVSAGSLRVVINSLVGNVVVSDPAAGRTVTFGLGLLGETGAIFPDGSRLLIGHAGADSLVGGTTSDGLYGGDGADLLSGGDGNDVLDGGTGQDVLSGGGGADRFVFQTAQSPLTAADEITDFGSGDQLDFAGIDSRGGGFVALTAQTLADATAIANLQISLGGADYVAVRVDFETYVFADTRDDNGAADDVVRLANVFFFGPQNIVGVDPGGAPPPAAPGAQGNILGNMDAVHLSSLIGAEITEYGPTYLSIEGDDAGLGLQGRDFTYDSNAQLTGGTVTLFSFSSASGDFQAFLRHPGVSAAPFERWVLTDATQEAFSTLLAGDDDLQGGAEGDLIRGFAGNDTLAGGAGANSLFGGTGDDLIRGYYQVGQTGGTPGANYLRGDEGNDRIFGSTAFDDINGNMGDDTCSGGDGGDWVVGGKDNDRLFGDAGDDIVYGNLGDDTCDGGEGADIVRGGQGNDILTGGAGNDWISGDRGDDSESGGSGADIFHSFGDAGVDRVVDFSAAEGDRVQLDPGTQYTVAQVGADTVISMTGGAQMILVGVTLSSLPAGWIFGA